MKKGLSARRLRDLVVRQVERDERAGIVECLEAGYSTIVERYGMHSAEGRAVERLVKVLKST